MANIVLVLGLVIALVSFITLVLRVELELTRLVAMLLAFCATILGAFVGFLFEQVVGVPFVYSLGFLMGLIFVFAAGFELVSE